MKCVLYNLNAWLVITAYGAVCKYNPSEPLQSSFYANIHHLCHRTPLIPSAADK